MRNTERIRELNDLARTTMGIGCRLVQTIGIAALPSEVQSRIREQVETFTAFTTGDDPYTEHDFGAFEILHEGATIRVFWKFDYYDARWEYGSENPANPAETRRLLTIMLASEY